MLTNNVDITVTDADVTAAITKIGEARTVLAAYLIASLTPGQRHDIFKMGRDSVQYVTENFNYAQDPDLKSNDIDLTHWSNDITANSQLQKVFNVLEPFFFDVFDMMTITGNEAMDESQANYRFLRFQAAEGKPKARAAYESLKALRWNRPTHKTPKTP